MLSQFNLGDDSDVTHKLPGVTEERRKPAPKQVAAERPSKRSQTVSPEDLISLDDDEFSDF